MGWGGRWELEVPKDRLGVQYPIPLLQAPSAHQSELGTNAQGRLGFAALVQKAMGCIGWSSKPSWKTTNSKQPFMSQSGDQRPVRISPLNGNLV